MRVSVCVVIVCVVYQAFRFFEKIGVFIFPVQRELFFHVFIGLICLTSQIHILGELIVQIGIFRYRRSYRPR